MFSEHVTILYCDLLEGGYFAIDKLNLSLVSGGDLSLPCETFAQACCLCPSGEETGETGGKCSEETGENRKKTGGKCSDENLIIECSGCALHCKTESETRSEVEYKNITQKLREIIKKKTGKKRSG